MTVPAAILIIGNELLDGRVHDKNSSFLAESLHQLGFEVVRILFCRDDLIEITEQLSRLLSESKVVITSGGLGPTSDDLTRNAIAKYCDVELEVDQGTLALLKNHFKKRHRPFDSSNVQQASFPAGSEILENPIGTAPGFACHLAESGQEGSLISLPGVPRELREMFTAVVTPMLARLYPQVEQDSASSITLFGLSESMVGGKITRMQLPAQLAVSYRASFPELYLKFSGSEADLAEYMPRIRSELGEEYIVSEEAGASLPQVVHSILLESCTSIATAESCTGGMIGELITENADSSSYYLGGAVCYSNEAKSSLLQVDPDLIKNHGAVSHEVARAMANGAREVFRSDLSISITGIAGPAGGSETKPVGTFFLGLASQLDLHSFEYHFPSTRSGVRRYAAFTACDLVRRYLTALPLQP